MSHTLSLFSLAGKCAVVTGGRGHLGKMICKTLLDLNATVISVDLPGGDRESSVNLHNFDCDITDAVEVQKLCRSIKEDLALDCNILVNNAAMVGSSCSTGWAEEFTKQTVDLWSRALDVNVTAAFRLAQAFSDDLTKSGGVILNIGSVYSDLGPDKNLYAGTSISSPAAYGVSKSALLQLTRWLAATLAPSVRVNSLSPGGVCREHASDFKENYGRKTPLGRMSVEQDYAGSIAFLCSPASEYLTGQNLIVDGGFSII